MDDLIDVIEGNRRYIRCLCAPAALLAPSMCRYSMALSDIQLHLLHDCLRPCGGWSFWCSLKQHDPKGGH